MSKLRQTKIRLLIYRLKETRNTIRNYFYIRNSRKRAISIINQLSQASTKKLCITIAFNTPWTIDLLIDCWLHFCSETTLLVADNSSNREKAEEIKAICKSKQIPYIKLPPNPVKHPSRSHGLALNWVWQNIILNAEQIKRVGFIDHDCYPIKPCRPNHISNAFAYGVPKSCWIEDSQAINIWAGFTFFSSESGLALREFNFNFLPDALNGLDTGGMNWQRVYRHLITSYIEEAKVRAIGAQDYFHSSTMDPKWSLQLINETFIHLSGVSHKSHFESFGRAEFCQSLRSKLLPNQLSNG